MVKILVTGGAGYIGSHIIRFLIKENMDIVVIDDLSTGHRESVAKSIPFYKCDLSESDKISEILKKEKVDAVIHLAGSISVGESMLDPLKYYQNNVINSINLLKAMEMIGVRKIIFSSTAAIFAGENKPLNEDSKKAPSNVYGRTKLIIENLIKDINATGKMNYGILRYFNAAGADDEGDIGEDHSPENHLIPLILQTALGKNKKVQIFGTDYPTKDGTCIRDYIHVNDLAEAHVLILKKILNTNNNFEYNIGSGIGYSVKEVISSVRQITGIQIEEELVSRRKGDSPFLVADPTKIKNELGWFPKYDLKKIITTAWKWHKNQMKIK